MNAKTQSAAFATTMAAARVEMPKARAAPAISPGYTGKKAQVACPKVASSAVFGWVA